MTTISRTGAVWQPKIDALKPPRAPAAAAQTAHHEAAWNEARAAVVYRVNDEPVYMRNEYGVSIIESKADGALFQAARAQAEALGLSGDDFEAFVHHRFEALMKEKYGDALEIQNFDSAADAPAMGELLDELEEAMFGNASEQRPATATPPLVRFSGDALTLLHGAEVVPAR